jgi:hypothetical protein
MRITLTLAGLLLFGCQSSPEVKKDTAALQQPAGVLVSLERGACFGRCPIYLVEVRTDGALHFKGERNVKVTEPVDVKLDAAQLAKLTARFEQSGFAGWPDFDDRQVTDQAMVVLTFKGKTVHHYLGDEKAPDELARLERDVDAILGTERWVNGVGTDTK